MIVEPPRHVLVVGAQCEGGGHLAGLEEAATELHRVLTDPELGGCVDRGVDSLLVGVSLGRNRVVDAVDEAARAAQNDGGSLVLALLGHGEGTDGAPLHFVTSGGPGDSALANVDVPSLLADVVNHPGLNGLIAIVDTCLAGGSVPAAPAIASGQQEGNVRSALLFASSAKEPAFELQLSRNLTRLIDEGIPGAGDFLKIDDALRDVLRDRVRGQRPGSWDFHGGGYTGSLWLARNCAVTRNATPGSIGGEALAAALRRIDSRLQLLTERKAQEWVVKNAHAETGPSRISVARLCEVLSDLRTVDKSLKALIRSFGSDLTEERLQWAALLAGIPLSFLDREPPRTLRDVVEHSVHHGSGVRGQQRTLALLIAAMTHVSGGIDTLPPALCELVEELELTAVVNSRLRELKHQSAQEAGPRLVVVLEDDGDEHVVRVDAWLLYGTAVLSHASFPCAQGNQGLGKALDEVVVWMSPWANLAGRRLQRIDVAAPTLVLLDSPAEERVVRRRKLGLNYMVTNRWSGMLRPPSDVTVHEMLQVGRQLLDSMGDSTSGPEWLGQHATESVERLQAFLDNRGFGQQVWALSRLPEKGWELMAQELLEHTPALVWPRQRVPGDTETIKESVQKNWQALPEQMALDYRKYLHDLAEDCGLQPPLAAMRAAWHDEEWQEFCTRRAKISVTAPIEFVSKEQE
ncbi:hypothetical protein [Streptomyces sp. NPDC059744]|uniref:vWA-MoxR associated conflict system protein n=1 Tax=Streptomyces sp. NPDC059744 TaxID=3346929 RepID=UPI0036580B9B